MPSLEFLIFKLAIDFIELLVIVSSCLSRQVGKGQCVNVIGKGQMSMVIVNTLVLLIKC